MKTERENAVPDHDDLSMSSIDECSESSIGSNGGSVFSFINTDYAHVSGLYFFSWYKIA